jgi:acetylornithine/succinyldiaminopimelate/putrescine aminotransferase
VLALLEAGVLTFPAGATVLRVHPPLTIETELLDVAADRIALALGG